MNVIYFLIPVSLLFAGAFLWAFIWAVRSGQYDDTHTPSMRVLLDEPRKTSRSSSSDPRNQDSALPATGPGEPTPDRPNRASSTISMPINNIPS